MSTAVGKSCTFCVNTAGHLQLEGDLTFGTVSAVFRQADSILKSDTAPQCIDLTSVNAVDSAGLALLLEWQSRHYSSGHSFKFTGAPDSLVSLARLCEATDLLQLSGREAP